MCWTAQWCYGEVKESFSYPSNMKEYDSSIICQREKMHPGAQNFSWSNRIVSWMQYLRRWSATYLLQYQTHVTEGGIWPSSCKLQAFEISCRPVILIEPLDVWSVWFFALWQRRSWCKCCFVTCYITRVSNPAPTYLGLSVMEGFGAHWIRKVRKSTEVHVQYTSFNLST